MASSAAVSTGTLDPTTYDPRVAQADPYPMYHALRAADPVMWNEATKTWIVSSHAIARTVMRDDEMFRQAFDHREVSRNGEAVREQPYFQLFRRMLFMMDGPDHKRVRPLFTRWFTGPERVRQLTPLVERIAREVLDDLEDRETFDVVKEVAYRIPLTVMDELLGVPKADSARIAHDIHDTVAVVESVQKTPEVKARADAAIIRLRDYFGDLVKQRRRHPGDDVVSVMVEDLDAGRFADEDELLANIVLMYLAGHETTTDSFALATLSLFRNPDQLALLREDPSLMRNGIEELIRYDGTAQGFSRSPVEDVMVGDKLVRAGQFILLLIGAANRDPAVFEDPDKLDLRRSTMKMVGFGGGAHACIGNMLARLELSTGLGELLRRKPNMVIENLDPPIEDFKPSLTRGLRRLQARSSG